MDRGYLERVMNSAPQVDSEKAKIMARSAHEVLNADGFIKRFPQTRIFTGDIDLDVTRVIGHGGFNGVFHADAYVGQFIPEEIHAVLRDLEAKTALDKYDSDSWEQSASVREIVQAASGEGSLQEARTQSELDAAKTKLEEILKQSGKFDYRYDNRYGLILPGVVAISHNPVTSTKAFREARKQVLTGALVPEWVSILLCAENINGHVVTFGEYAKGVPYRELSAKKIKDSLIESSAAPLVETIEVQEVIPKYDSDIKLRTDAMIQTGRGIAKAHAKKIIHRDIKPQNMAFSIEKDHYRGKILDWGNMLFMDARDEEFLNFRTTGVLPSSGTPMYAPPEQFFPTLGEMDERTDIFSFGASLYEVVTQRPPLPEDPHINWRVVICERPPESLPLYPTIGIVVDSQGNAQYGPRDDITSEDKKDLENLALVMAGCLNPVMGNRYPQMNLVLDDLESVLDGYRPHHILDMVYNKLTHVRNPENHKAAPFPLEELPPHKRREMYLRDSFREVPEQFPDPSNLGNYLFGTACVGLSLFLGSIYVFGKNPTMGSPGREYRLGDRIEQRVPDAVRPYVHDYKEWAEGAYEKIQEVKRKLKD